MIGAEGRGLSPAVRRRVDLFVRIPMAGKVASLNAAVAGSILLFEALGQRPVAAQPVPAPEAPLVGSSNPVASIPVGSKATGAPESDDLPHVGG